MLQNTHPGRSEKQRHRIKIDKLYEVGTKSFQTKRNLFNGIELGLNPNDLNYDVMGYIGRPHRSITEQELTKEEFVKLIADKGKLKEIRRLIRQIDPEKNGYVTETELTDLF